MCFLQITLLFLIVFLALVNILNSSSKWLPPCSQYSEALDSCRMELLQAIARWVKCVNSSSARCSQKITDCTISYQSKITTTWVLRTTKNPCPNVRTHRYKSPLNLIQYSLFHYQWSDLLPVIINITVHALLPLFHCSVYCNIDYSPLLFVNKVCLIMYKFW